MSETTVEILGQVLSEILKVSKSQAITDAKVDEINKTIHNGMSASIVANCATLKNINSRLGTIEGRHEFGQAEKEKKKLRLSTTQKTIMWILGLVISLGTAIGIWTRIF